MTWALAIGTVLFAGTGMGLHKLANQPVLEVCMWVATFLFFVGFQAALHR
ncbi:MAG: hypothetical protein Q8R40_04455 [bacterium]|nr:hypothetical protein [bacterium]